MYLGLNECLSMLVALCLSLDGPHIGCLKPLGINMDVSKHISLGLPLTQTGHGPVDYLLSGVSCFLSLQLFQWKQLENLYFREKKFAVEVNDPDR